MTPEVTTRLEGDLGRSEDGRAREDGRAGGGGRAQARADLAGRHDQLPGHDRRPAARRCRCRSPQTIKEEGGTWVVTDTAKLPMGDAVDTTTLDKGTLVAPQARRQAGAGRRSSSTFADGKATGTMAMGGEPKPMSVDLGGELFADGAGANEALASLPLAEGYTHHLPQLRRAAAEGAAEAGQGHRHRERDRAGRHVQGLEGRDHLGRRRARPDHALDRQGQPQGRQDSARRCRRWAARW